jgi:hypothetical protein
MTELIVQAETAQTKTVGTGDCFDLTVNFSGLVSLEVSPQPQACGEDEETGS